MSFLKYKILMTCRSKTWIGKLEYRYWLTVYALLRRWKKLDSNLVIGIVAVLVLILQVFIIVTAVKGQSINEQQARVGMDPEEANRMLIGQALPNLEIRNILNHHSSTVNYTDLKGKVVLFAFWTSGCRGAREEIQKLDAVQKQFGDRVQIFAVSNEDREVLTRVLEKDALLFGIKLPVVAEDRELKQLFPHESLPHVVWIGQDGIVKAITTSQYVRSANVLSVLNDEPNDWPEKRDYLNYDYDKLLLKPTAEGLAKPELRYHSTLTGYMPGVSPKYGVQVDSSRQVIRTYVINYPVYKMYLMAFSRFLGVPENHMIWEVKDKGRYIYEDGKEYQDQWNRRNAYCYESLLPLGISTEERLGMMQADLNHYLRVNCRMEKRMTDVLVLVRGKGEVKASDGGKAVNNLYTEDQIKKLRNLGLSALTSQMNSVGKNPPVLDETGFKGKVDLDLKVGSWADIEAVRKTLKPYGLDLKKARREVEFLVFTELDQPSGKGVSK